MLDYGDTASGFQSSDFTPRQPFLNAEASALPLGADDIVVAIPNGQGATGFAGDTAGDGTVWSPNPTFQPNRLSAAVARYNAAVAYLTAQGYTIVHRGWSHTSARPDLPDTGGTYATAARISNAAVSFVDYLRANLTGVSASYPVTLSAGMPKADVDGGTDRETFFSAINGVRFRRPYAGNIDVMSDHGFGVSGVPVPLGTDGTHTTHAGEVTKGLLERAVRTEILANAAPSAPWSDDATLWADMAHLYDFRSGCGVDLKGGADLTTIGGMPNIRFESLLKAPVWKAGLTGTRNWAGLPAVTGPFTFSALVMPDAALAANAVIVGNRDVMANSITFIANASKILQFSMGSSTYQLIGTTALSTTAYTLVTVTYDGTTARIYVGGVLDGTQAIALPATRPALYVGGVLASGAGYWRGGYAGLASWNRALTGAEVAALAAKSWVRA